MTKFVLIPDATLNYDYRNFPLLDFMPCAPSTVLPEMIYSFLRGSSSPPLPDGRAKYAPYALRKLEAALALQYGPNDVVVAHEDHMQDFIKDDTKVIGVSTMDPLGAGPLTMSYSILFGTTAYPWVKKEWYRLMGRINAVRKGTKAKLVVGGPGVWEFMIFPEELERCGIDYAFQGEADDIAPAIFEQLGSGDIDSRMFYHGYMSYDDNFRRAYKEHERFVTRKPGTPNYPTLEQIPLIQGATMKGMSEVMRGCGVGCDFCEVTLRPSRYYTNDMIRKEVEVNVRNGWTNAWLHSDEIFAYKHGRLFEPNEDALLDMFTAVMSIPGVKTANPTHGRISIPAAYPDLIGKLSGVLRAGPSNWIGVQVGVETGSERLAQMHMPNKTLPLKIGKDGSWQDIVWWGVHNFNRNYWRPAFTVQVGQNGEEAEDNWQTVEMINRMSNSYYDGKPFEFTITPMQNVPLGLIKSRKFTSLSLSESQLAVYYASYRHLAKMAARDSPSATSGKFMGRVGTAALIAMGGWLMLKGVERICRKKGLDVEKVKRYGIDDLQGDFMPNAVGA